MTEITDEQRAAWERVQHRARNLTAFEADLALIVPLLPSELTNPQPALPTEPGWYLDKEGEAWRLLIDQWFRVHDGEPDAHCFAPFTRLVPERPPITGEQVPGIIGAGFSVSSSPGGVLFNDAVFEAIQKATQ